MSISVFQELEKRGQELLAAFQEDQSVEAAAQFDALYYEAVWRRLRESHAGLGARVATYLGLDGVVAPQVLPSEVDEVAHDATGVALRRVRNKAAGFDSKRGALGQWIIGASEFAYIEAAKTIVKSRRSNALEFVDPASLLEISDDSATTEEHVMLHLDHSAALAQVASHVSEKEFTALRLRLTAGYSRAEAAVVIFGDESMKKQVDGLVERGKRKLAKAWADRDPSNNLIESSNLPRQYADREEADE